MRQGTIVEATIGNPAKACTAGARRPFESLRLAKDGRAVSEAGKDRWLLKDLRLRPERVGAAFMLVSCDAAASINGINKDARLRASPRVSARLMEFCCTN